MKHDVFISYASEDEETFVSPLAELLIGVGAKVWFAPVTIKLGDSLSRSIDKGLANSKFGVVVISKAFIAKAWTEYELRGLTSKAIGKDKVILPIWHNISRQQVLHFSPPLADTYALDTSRLNLNEIVIKIIEVIRPDIYQNYVRLLTWEQAKSDAKVINVTSETIKPSSIRHTTLPDDFLLHAKVINYVLFDVLPIPLDEMINGFRRDVVPYESLFYWNRIAAAYLEATYSKGFSKEKRKDILSALLAWSTGVLDESDAYKFQHLSYKQVMGLRNLYLKVVPKISRAKKFDPKAIAQKMKQRDEDAR